jgi:hypothetical protein
MEIKLLKIHSFTKIKSEFTRFKLKKIINNTFHESYRFKILVQMIIIEYNIQLNYKIKLRFSFIAFQFYLI